MQSSKFIVSIGIILILILNVFGQEERVKIVKILDTNLFQLDDGRLIQMDEIAVPSIASRSEFKKYLANRIFDYAKAMLLGAQVLIRYDSSKVKAGAPLKVHLFKIYPLEKLDINRLYLERGYGKFVPHQNSSYLKAYAAAEKLAKRKHLGIWRKIQNIPEVTQRRHLLYYRAGNKNIFGDQFRVIGFHTHSETRTSVADFRIGFSRSAAKVRTCTDCRDYLYWKEIVHRYGGGYLQMIFGKKSKRLTISIGAFGYISGTRGGYISISRIGLSPIVRFRYLFNNGLYLKAALTDNYGFVYPDYPIELAVGKWFADRQLHLWSGLVKSRARFHAVGGLTYDFGPYSVIADFGYGLNTNNIVGELQLGFFLR